MVTSCSEASFVTHAFAIDCRDALILTAQRGEFGVLVAAREAMTAQAFLNPREQKKPTRG
jgi:hypothetical protein